MPKSEWRDEWLYAAIALPVALIFALLTPPFQSPDEVGHYWHATAIAQGELVSPKVAGRPSAMIPTDARDLVATLWMELAGKDVKYATSKFHDARQLRPTHDTVRVYFPAFYTAVPYAPQALALFVARLVHCPTLHAFYVGRIANAIIGILLVIVAMRMLPGAAWIFGSVGLTPMFLYLAGTYSADVATIGLAFCTTAAALRTADVPSRFEKGILPISATLLSLAKPGYSLIALIRFPRLKERAELMPILLALVGVMLGGWFASNSARAAYYPMRSDVVTDAARQLAQVAQAPLHFLRLAASDYITHSFQYIDHLVGRLGWLDIGLPRLVVISYIVLFVYVAVSVSLRVTGIERAILASVFLATLLLLSLSQYLIWTPVGGTSIEGLQGRYFIPVVPLALLLMSTRRVRLWRWAICALTMIGNAIALYTLAAHYYTF
jgi:uncharacterized membrane protein